MARNNAPQLSGPLDIFTVEDVGYTLNVTLVDMDAANLLKGQTVRVRLDPLHDHTDVPRSLSCVFIAGDSVVPSWRLPRHLPRLS